MMIVNPISGAIDKSDFVLQQSDFHIKKTLISYL
jgi:hypothetical protein